MLKLLGKWLKIYQDEIGIFFWCTALIFLIRSSGILFNNFAETAFLKRFGVEYLPVIYVINSISTFFIMGFMTGILGRLPGGRLLSNMLVICGVSVAGLRFVIPLGFELIYPVLFVLKSQYEVLLGLLFWNLANDLFNTRQSKRLFPLITAGGVMGGIIGSFATPPLAKAISIDNLLWAYLGTTLAGAILVKRMGASHPTLLLSEKQPKKARSRPSLKEEFKKVLPIIKESDLVKVLIMLTLLPNVVIPIMNYQFNYAIDQTFATEGGMIQFFGYFRGVLNIISFIILLFVGRIYGRWGLPVALMFHPFNYMIAFLAFLFKFDIFSAMYARMSTTVLRTTINNPARAILMGLFPGAYRSSIRPFLRGTVVRVGVLTGSGLIMVFEGILHPRYLSIVAALFVAGWFISTLILKKRYPRILLDLISKDMLDLRSLEEEDASHIFSDKKVQTQLVGAFLSSKGNSCLWYANLMKTLGIENLDAHILAIIKEQDEATKLGLLPLLSPRAGREALQVFEDLVGENKPDLTTAAVKAASLLPVDLSSGFLKKIFDAYQSPEIGTYAVIGLYGDDPETYGKIIGSWLSSADKREKRAGILAAGGSNNREYISFLQEMLRKEEDGSIVALILEALYLLEAPGMNDHVFPYLAHPSESVREAALNALTVTDDEAMRAVIPLLGDHSTEIQKLARVKLHDSPHQNSELLIESLALPNRSLREGVFHLLESLRIRDVDVVRCARAMLERAYRNLAEAEALLFFQESRERDLLREHLLQKKEARLETLLRVLVTQDHSGQMRIIWRGLSSADSRQRSNAIEALEDSLERSISGALLPLLEDLPPSQALAEGRKTFQIPSFDSDRGGGLYRHLLAKYDWVTVVLSLNFIGKEGPGEGDQGIEEELVHLMKSENPHVRQMAQRTFNGKHFEFQKKETEMEEEISIPNRILHLESINIFKGLSVSELAAIASVTEEVVYPEGTVVIKEGEVGETMYMIISGEVSVLKGEDMQIELDRMGAGANFGEMAFFDKPVRSASIRTEEKTRLVLLHKREFTEIVREYPQIALHICNVFSRIIRELQKKIRQEGKESDETNADSTVT
jgi:hypothetical protein